MNVSNPRAHPSAVESSRASEQSMEDILSSIRKIISDDQRGMGLSVDPNDFGLSRRRAAPPEPEPEREPQAARRRSSEHDLRRLASTQASEWARGEMEPPPARGRSRADEDEVVREDARLRGRGTSPDDYDDDFLDDEDDDDDHGVFESERSPGRREASRERAQRAEALLSQRVGESVSNAFETLSATVIANQSRSLEDVVSDLLRPLLKDWLDQNLPEIVERLVRVEIERLARVRRD